MLIPELSTTDTLGRALRDLRISVTDRCNFRCGYCMPKEIFGAGYQFLERSALLSFEEIERVAGMFAALGVKKLRITGGEPLVRRNLERLIEKLAQVPGIEDISLTTNGSLLSLQKAQQLKDAGLQRVTVSLDALDDDKFKTMNDVGFPVTRVLAAIDHAAEAGLAPIKVNMVVKKGVNDADIVTMAKYFRDSGHILRFIEYMDVGSSNGWRMDQVVSAKHIVARLNAELPLEPAQANYRGEVAKRWRYRDGSGEVGVIASVTQPFCGACSRARISAEGKLYTCLFASQGFDLRAKLRDQSLSDADICNQLVTLWKQRNDRYSELRSQENLGDSGSADADAACRTARKIEMSYIGG